MKSVSRSSIVAVYGVLALLSGCAGSPQWEKQTVAGSSGTVTEIRASRSQAALPPGAQAVPQEAASQASRQAVPQVPQRVVAQMEAQGRHGRIQEQLLKHAAMMQKPDFTDYKVGPEDLLQVNFLDAEKLTSEARVNGQGYIRLLLVNDVKVSGLTPVEISRKLARLYKAGDFLRNPQITVAVKEFRHQRVAVTGAVNKPEYYSLIGPRYLLDVLGMAGGLSDKAGEVVHVMRPQNVASGRSDAVGGPQLAEADTMVVDLNRLLLKGEVTLNISIQNGDVVFVPFAQTAYVLGAVTKPGGVLLKDNMTVTKAVSQSGGLNPLIASKNATIVRVDELGQRQTISVDLGQITTGKAGDVALQENDIVFVHESGVRRFFFDIKQFFPGGVGLSPLM
ncbi:MAG: polysaccharide biosynthesis/export family protein [Syntrophobacter sp.]